MSQFKEKRTIRNFNSEVKKLFVAASHPSRPAGVASPCFLPYSKVVSLFPPQLNSVGARERLTHLLSAEPSELLLDPSEALRLTTETYRLWTVAAAYGQACEMFVWVNKTNAPLPLDDTHRHRRNIKVEFVKFRQSRVSVGGLILQASIDWWKENK